MSVFGAWVIVRLWAWFVAERFELPALTMADVFGLGIVAGAARLFIGIGTSLDAWRAAQTNLSDEKRKWHEYWAPLACEVIGYPTFLGMAHLLRWVAS